jgi:hypothetical protein
MPLLLQQSVLPLFVHTCNDRRLLPLLRQFLLIQNRIRMFMDLRAKCSTAYFKQLHWFLIKNEELCLFNFSIAISNSKALPQSLVVLLSLLCLSTINNRMYTEQLREMVPPPSQSTVGDCKQITLLVQYCIRTGLVTLLKIIDASIQVSDISLS